MRRILLVLTFVLFSSQSMARDFEQGYAVYGAGSDTCSMYLQSMRTGGKELDYFVDWTIGYFSAFNVVMPETYNILGETDFPTAQRWLERHCRKYPKEMYVTAVIKLTEVLYPMRFKSSPLAKPETKPAPTAPAKLKDVSKSVKQ